MSKRPRKINLKAILFYVSIFLLLLFIFYLARRIYVKKSSTDLNLILISVDTLRADHMGVYGYPKNTTPNIDKWAKGAFVFTNVRTTVPVTFPSFVSLMTGKSQFDTRIYNNFGIVFNEGGHPLDKNTLTLAEILKKNGYETGAFVTNLALKAENTNLDREFDKYNFLEEDPADEENKEKYSKFILNSIDWMNKNRNNKFFLWVHLSSPHAPYNPPADFRCMLNNNYCEEINRRGVDEIEKERKSLEGCQKEKLGNETIELFEALYDGEIAFDDQLVGSIINKINITGLEKKTLVILYGDHGEGFDHNYYFMHGNVLYDSSIRIPFIIKHPLLSSTSRSIKASLANTQILPTLLELLNVPFEKESVTGKRFSALLYNDLFSKFYTTERYTYSVNPDLSKYSIQDGRYKFIHSLGFPCLYKNQTEMLYDLLKDPKEHYNLIYKKPEEAEKLKKALFEYLAKYDLPKPLGEVVNQRVSPQQQELIEKLKSLGY